MNMQTLDHRRASHVAARTSLVFYALSSRVSQKKSDRLRGARGLTRGSLVRVLPPQTLGRFSRCSASKILCGVQRLACRSGEKNAPALSGQTSCCTPQTGEEPECGNAVKSRDDLID